MELYDFSGWATRNNVKCSDGRTIRKDAFKHNDGQTVPLVWNHNHNDPLNVLGHALLENREDGVYTYCKFNDTEAGQNAKLLVQHGDVVSLSIYANQLKQQGGDVLHGAIREVSLVLAGANPGAFIDTVMAHGEESEESAYIYTGEDISLFHADEETETTEETEEVETPEQTEEIGETEGESASETEEVETSEDVDATETEESSEGSETSETSEETIEHSADNSRETAEDSDESIIDILNTLDEKQQLVVYGLIARAWESEQIQHSNEGEDEIMKENVFDKGTQAVNTLSHADEQAIIKLAKSSGVGSLKAAMEIYVDEHQDTLAHGFTAEDMGQLFPDFKDVHPGAPELIERDQSWVGSVMNKAKKSPASRVRTRQADARAKELRAKGYNNRQEEKALSGNVKLLMRTTDPQTIYYRDELHRDDITDITDFDLVAYNKTVMKHGMEEVIALAALVGDQREDTDPDKIHETHIRPIWKDEPLYTIHADVDIEAMKTKLQGTNTNANFGEEYIYTEAVIAAALYAREQYKGKGTPDYYCDPHSLNVMLLARDLNGRRIYDSKSDLAKALNVGEIHTVEQFTGLTRTTEDGDTKKLIGIFVNMGNYQFGSTKGGELTSFEDFDIDFNKYKYLMETRLSGALTEIYSAIALEQPVTNVAG